MAKIIPLTKRYVLFFLFFTFFSFSSQGESFTTVTNIGKQQAKNDSIIFINKSDKRIGFSYEDQYLNLVRLHLMPKSSSSIWVNNELLLTQSNENQNFYLLKAGDTIYAELNSLGDAIFSVANDSIRNNELNLSWKMNESTPLNFWKINKLIGKYFDNDYKEMDSIYRSDYNAKSIFLNNYVNLHPVPKLFEDRIKNYLKSQLLGSQLWLGTASKDKIGSDYLDYLASLKDEVIFLTEDQDQLLYNRLKYVYLRFGFKNLMQKDYFPDSMYTSFQKEPDGKIKEEMLFNIVKNEIENNRTSKKWFIADFVQTTKNVDFKNYILTTLDNNKLIALAGNSTILINKDSDKSDYNTLLKSLTGKVVYIDVWASWCAPCRAEMPNSNALRDAYKNEGIAFLYISIDENIMAWKKANKEEKLDVNSYVVLNAQHNEFVKNFKISTIPRYIVLDKDGKIVNANAPRPGDSKIKTLFNKLLNK